MRYNINNFNPNNGNISRTRPIFNTVLVLDVSSSMNDALDGSLSKLDVAKAALVNMIDGKRINHPKDGIAIVTFSGTVNVVSGFRKPNDNNLILCLKRISADGCTNISAGLLKALGLHRQRPAHFCRNIILATDGIPYPEDTKVRVLSVARQAYSERVTINCIGIGSENDFDPDFLRQVAESTHNGRYFNVKDLGAFTRAIITASNSRR